jgi:surface polysaccharide O-acyltransferase-like enzyme
MRKCTGWLRDLISQSSDTQTSEYLKKLTCGPIFTIVIYEGYAINGYTFYTKQQDKKARIRVVVHMLMLMMLRAKTKYVQWSNTRDMGA